MLIQVLAVTAVLVILVLQVGKLFVLVVKGERSATTGWIVGLGLIASVALWALALWATR